VKGRNDDDWYRIHSISVSACSGFWEIPSLWSENMEPSLQNDGKYNFWGWIQQKWMNVTQSTNHSNGNYSDYGSNQVVHGLLNAL